jgi:hypothetical protein
MLFQASKWSDTRTGSSALYGWIRNFHAVFMGSDELLPDTQESL